MKLRLDRLLHQRGLASSGEKAKQQIKAGLVKVDGIPITKPGMKVDPDCRLEVETKGIAYVSRGGLKLEKALKTFGLELSGKTCADIGASTGGFTDCMLKSGADKVYAVDVGTDQLDPGLKADPRVISLEKVNARDLDPKLFKDAVDFISIDVSFISLGKVLPALSAITHAKTELVALIKPQFEAGPKRLGKKGVVKDRKVHAEILEETALDLVRNDWKVEALSFSPILGPKGNIEFLAFCRRSNSGGNVLDKQEIIQVVAQAHTELKKGD